MVHKRIRDYLKTIEEIDFAERRLAKQSSAINRAPLGSALDAAKAAWLLIPAEVRLRLDPSPERKHDSQRLARLQSVRELD